MALRPIRAMRELVDGKLVVPELGTRPELRWVNPTSLLVDETYQRNLSERSRRLIARIIFEFAWSKMKPPVVVRDGSGYHCIDGQHTAIAAATLGLPEIPVFVVEADSVQLRAESFVAHNNNRVAMSPIDLYRARVAAGDPNAVATAAACRATGVTIKLINPQARVDIGDTIAISTIQKLVRRQGNGANKILEALVKGGRAPISAAEIEAVEAVMAMLKPDTTVQQMANVILALSDHGVLEARLDAAAQGIPHKHALFKKYVASLENTHGKN